jgi:aryl-alcohol dehydrogenase-like predicted oxidoreductase
MMNRTKLGSSGLEVSLMGLGCLGMSDFYGSRDDAESIATIDHALNIGVTFLDTSDMYGIGENEELIGRAIRSRRNEVQLATKFGILRDSNGKIVGVNGRPEYVKSACEQSLRRLGTDVIDLYYLHRVDPNTAIEETIGAMSNLVNEGKVRCIGLCEASASTISRAHAVHPLSAVQSEYSLWSRDVEREVLPACEELGIGFVAYSPLGRGFLTGKLKSMDALPETDNRKHQPRFQGDNFQRNLDLVSRIEEMAADKRCTPAQLVLSWLFYQGGNIVPIPGTKRRVTLNENANAVHVRLTDEDVGRLRKLVPPEAVAGERYPESGMRLLNL